MACKRVKFLEFSTFTWEQKSIFHVNMNCVVLGIKIIIIFFQIPWPTKGSRPKFLITHMLGL